MDKALRDRLASAVKDALQSPQTSARMKKALEAVAAALEPSPRGKRTEGWRRGKRGTTVEQADPIFKILLGNPNFDFFKRHAPKKMVEMLDKAGYKADAGYSEDYVRSVRRRVKAFRSVLSARNAILEEENPDFNYWDLNNRDQLVAMLRKRLPQMSDRDIRAGLDFLHAAVDAAKDDD